MPAPNPDARPRESSPGPKQPPPRRRISAASAMNARTPLHARGPEGAPRINKMEGAIMIALAGLIDFIQFILTLIPFIGWAISWVLTFVAWGIFFIWFAHKGMNLLAQTRALGTLGAMLGEFVPFINAFPWWTARISVVVLHEWRKGSGV